ncbi:MAG: C25 family cysteine peptidase [Thermoplasmatota archaeon]
MKAFHHRSVLFALGMALLILSAADPLLSSNDETDVMAGTTTGQPAFAAQEGQRTRAAEDLAYIQDLVYAAIGPGDFEDELKPLMDWKTQKGVRAAYYPLDGKDGVLSISYGRDKQERIRNFIRDLKEVNPTLKWVLLAGDGEIIPPRLTYANESVGEGGDEEGNFVLSDYYYAGLEGSWDFNGNNVFGEYKEADWQPDVYVGRFPASTEKEISIMVSKQLSYEKDPPPGSWSSSMLLAGSLMDTPNNPLAYQSYKDNAYELVLAIEKDLPDHVDAFPLVDYPKLEYGGYNQMFDTLNRSSFEAYYSTGFSTVIVACHGDPFNGNCTNYKGESGGRKDYLLDYEDHFTYDMAETIENGRRLPLVYISSCGSTNFSEQDDTNMERLLRNPNGGAIALVGATVDTYRGEFRPDPEEPNENYSYGNWWLAQEFYRLLYNGNPRPGEALYKQKWNYINYVEDFFSYDPLYFRMFYIDNLAYNLMGDPEGPIWLDEPRSLRMEVENAFVYDSGFLHVRVLENDRTLKGARVTVTCPSDPALFVSEVTDTEGKVSIPLARENLAQLRITAVKDGFIPSTVRIDVVSDRNLRISDLVFDPEVAVGNEELTLSVLVSNTGSRDIEAFKLKANLTNIAKDQEVFPFLDLKANTSARIEITPRLNIPSYGFNDLVLHAEIVSFQDQVIIESDMGDNTLTKRFRANYPIQVTDYFPRIELHEDSSLSSDSGPLNLTPTFFTDLDEFPHPISIWTDIISGNLEAVVSENQLDVVPSPDWFGKGRIMVYASDGSVTRYGTIEVEVLPVPDAPSFIVFPSNVTLKEDVRSSFRVILEDIDSETVELRSELDWVTTSAVPNSTGMEFMVEMIPTGENVGQSILKLVASDDAGKEAEVNIYIQVNQTNDPPLVGGPTNLTVQRGKDLVVDLIVEDPDGDTDFVINVSWEFGTFTTTYTNFTLKVPDDAEPGDYFVQISVRDSSGGTYLHILEVTVQGGKGSASIMYVVVIAILIILGLLAYGVILRIQETRQRRLLGSVGTNAPLEARTLSEKDFLRVSRRRKKDSGIPMPPVPVEVEGSLAREGRGVETQKEESGKRDLDTDVDEVISELFP